MKDFLTKSTPEIGATAALTAEFIFKVIGNSTTGTDKVAYQLWYTSTNDKALDFVKNFKEDHLAMADKVEFSPHIVSWACTSCDADFKRKHCVSNGRYCAMNHKSTYIEGKDILMEDLREVCLHKLLTADKKSELWW